MTGLALGDRAEERGDIRVALDVGLLREVEVAPVRLTLAGERLLQVLVRLGAFQRIHSVLSPCQLGRRTVRALAAEDDLDVCDGEVVCLWSECLETADIDAD